MALNSKIPQVHYYDVFILASQQHDTAGKLMFFIDVNMHSLIVDEGAQKLGWT